MLKNILIPLAIIAFGSPSTSQNIEWQDIGGELSASIVRTAGSETNGNVSGFALDQIGLEIELKSAAQILIDHYPGISRDWFTTDEKGKRVSIEPSVQEVWNIVSQNKNVVGLVPIGYSEVAGGAEIAGFYKIDGVSNKSLFSAPNMDTVICLNDLARENHSTQNFNVPFLFDTKIGPSYSYSYYDDVDLVVVGHLDNPKRWLDTFETCQNMIQIGFRLIDPLHIMRNRGKKTRMIEKLPTDLNVDTFPLTAFMFDRNARFNFIRFKNISPIDAARTLSSEGFQQKTCRSRVTGASNCEIWATMLTAFDDAGLYIRTSPKEEATVFGNPNVISPAVLILKVRGGEKAPASNDLPQQTD